VVQMFRAMSRKPGVAFLARMGAGPGAALGGLGLIVGVVAWRLCGATYRADIETLCGAESRSHLTLSNDMPALNEWLGEHLVTPDGNELLARLGDVPMADRAERLRATATAQGVSACPMAHSYDRLVAAGAYRAELQLLCSYVTFPHLADGDDAARLADVEAWIDNRASDARTRALAGPLRVAQTSAERARLLRAASRDIGIFTCDVAKVLESPPPAPDAGGADD
jgi:hypothetical protein